MPEIAFSLVKGGKARKSMADFNYLDQCMA